MSLRISRTDDLAQCLALRRTVFVEEQGVPIAEERDALDATAQHYLAWLDDRPVGTARVVRVKQDAKIGRVCLLPTARGAGRGAALIQALLDELQTDPTVTRAILGAQTNALGFYTRLGFTAYGPVFDDAGIPHQMMERTV